MSSFTRTVLGVIFILIIAFCGTFIFARLTSSWGGVDLTEGNVYTLSPGSKAIVAKLERPLTMKLFYAKEAADRTGNDVFRAYHNYFYYVRDLLRDYQRESGGRITLEEYDPRPYSPEAEEAERLGIQAFPLTETEMFYFGLAVTSGGGAKETVPFFSLDMQPQLEYRISELIDVVSRRKKSTLGVLSSLPIASPAMSDYMRQMMAMQGQPVDEPWVAIRELRRMYEVESVAADAKEIDPELDYLLVVHPKNLGDATLYAIDQFVMRGGKLLAFTDPNCLMGDQPPQQNMFGGGGHDASSQLNKLFAAWGVRMEPGQFAGDLRIAQRLRTQTGAVRFPGALEFVGAECLNPSEIVTQDLDTVYMLTAGVLRSVPEVEGVEVVPLITTTERGNTWTASPMELGGPRGLDLEGLARKFNEGVDEVWTAARVSGTLRSAFPDGAPASVDAAEDEGEEAAAEPADETKAPHLAQSVEPNAAILIADVDMLTDNVAFRRSFIGYEMANSNLALLTNALEFLAGSNDLISIRTRKKFHRPFDVVDRIETEADLAAREQVQRINDDIAKFESELQGLNSQATEQNVGLLQSEAFDSRRKLEERLREKRLELREVQKSKLERIEALGATIKNINIFGVPALVALIGIVLFLVRSSRRREQVRGGVA